MRRARSTQPATPFDILGAFAVCMTQTTQTWKPLTDPTSTNRQVMILASFAARFGWHHGPVARGMIWLSVAFSVLICSGERKAMHRVLVHGPLANASLLLALGMPILSGRASNRQMQNNLLHEDCGNMQTPSSIKLQLVHISHPA